MDAMAWSKAARAKHVRAAERIESDLTDAAWNWLAPLPPPKLDATSQAGCGGELPSMNWSTGKVDQPRSGHAPNVGPLAARKSRLIRLRAGMPAL
ncbi:MAG: hypothetical protein J4F47_10870, partial [Alphaproteobacteria bacterium]|nr:hypothetical protein [Alphaproteobacteria bacterium]